MAAAHLTSGDAVLGMEEWGIEVVVGQAAQVGIVVVLVVVVVVVVVVVAVVNGVVIVIYIVVVVGVVGHDAMTRHVGGQMAGHRSNSKPGCV